MTSGSGSNDGDWPLASSEASGDDLGNTQLGRSLKELIAEIAKEKDALQQKLTLGEAPGTESQDADAFDPSQSHFEQVLEQAGSAEDESEPVESDAADAGARAPAPHELAGTAEAGGGHVDADMSQAMSGMEAVLQRYAEAERRRCEERLAEWKEQLKKATMIVIKKQVDSARVRWTQSQSANEMKIAEQYRRLKVLAEKVAKQKAQIQGAKQELEEKLAIADRLHTEFDEIRQVLDGQIGAIDALDSDDDLDET